MSYIKIILVGASESGKTNIWTVQDSTGGLTLNRLYAFEDKQVIKLVAVHDNAKQRVQKEVARVIPGFHTK